METKKVDLLVIGFGMAGASTAMQALETAEREWGKTQKPSILLVDRFEGGGSTSRSGGIIYFGGGTDVQRKLNVTDSVENMFAYLKMETNGAVSDETLYRFCATSAESASWLRDSFQTKVNVPDDTALLCPFKTSNAPDRYSLFYSGSETAFPFTERATPSARGHKAMTHGRNVGNLVGTGNVLFHDMERAILACKSRGLEVETFTKCTELVFDKERVVGAKLLTMKNAPTWVMILYRVLSRVGGLTNPLNYADTWILNALSQLEARYGHGYEVLASRGVVLACGGFGRNTALVDKFIPKYANIMPIGSIGDDGFGIFELGVNQAKASAVKLENASAWKFIVPSGSMAKGILVNSKGERITNEEFYGARLAEASMVHNDGVGFLILDETHAQECRDEVFDGEMLLFQKAFTYLNLNWNRIKCASLAELAEKTGCGQGLIRSVEEYNAHCESGKDDKFGKRPHLLQALTKGPYYAIRFDSRGTLWPTPFFSLGGLEVKEQTGQVVSALNKDQVIPGLFAAGRNASGVCSNSYVSGLSLADGLFSGRRVGEFAMSGKVFGAAAHAKL